MGRQLTRVCFVGVLLQTFLALGELEMVLVDDGVEGKVATADHLAGVAMAGRKVSHESTERRPGSYQRTCFGMFISTL